MVREGRLLVDMKVEDNLKIKFWYFKINKCNEFILKDTLHTKVCLIQLKHNKLKMCVLCRVSLSNICLRAPHADCHLGLTHISRYTSLAMYT